MDITEQLRRTLAFAYDDARARRHEYVMLEHILYALTEDESPRSILRALGVDRGLMARELDQFFAESINPMRREQQPKQTPTFERVLERAARQMSAAGKTNVDVGNVLAAFYLEPSSHAVYLLQKQGVTRLDVLEYVSHGVSKVGA